MKIHEVMNKSKKKKKKKKKIKISFLSTHIENDKKRGKIIKKNKEKGKKRKKKTKLGRELIPTIGHLEILKNLLRLTTVIFSSKIVP